MDQTTDKPIPREILIETKALHRRYGAALAVTDLNLSLRKGEILGLLGPNGAGKTTALRMLAGTLAPTSGTVRIKGIDMTASPKAAKANLGYLPEKPPIYGELTVDEYLGYCARLHDVPASQQKPALARAKQSCGLSDTGRRLISNLSTGYRQRVGLAQAIIHNPEVIILDEPTVGLDPNQIREIRSLITALGDNHSVILSSHILPEVQAVCNRVMIIDHGRVVYAERLAATDPAQMESVSLRLRAPPPVAALEQLSGISAVQTLEPGQFRLQLKPGADPREQLAEAAVHNGWGLLELRAEIKTLEQRFVELTSGETALKAAA